MVCVWIVKPTEANVRLIGFDDELYCYAPNLYSCTVFLQIPEVTNQPRQGSSKQIREL